MIGVDHDHVLFTKQRQIVQPLVVLPAGHAIDSHLEVAVEQSLLEHGGARINQVQLDPFVPGLHGLDQIDQMLWRNRAHDSQLQRCLPQADEIDRLLLDGLRLLVHVREVRQDHVAELG